MEGQITEKDLKEVAKEALQQIIDKQYETEMKKRGIDRILKLGLAFKGKVAYVLSEENL